MNVSLGEFAKKADLAEAFGTENEPNICLEILKSGEMQVSDYQTDTYTVQEIAQEVRAEEPGTYSFGPSILEGVSYGEDISGRKLYDKQRLRAELEPLQVEVAAFPEEGMPASFTGAVGQYAMRTKLLTPKEVAIGDPLEVGVGENPNPKRRSFDR